MIGYLKGKLIARTPEYALINVGGVGYEVYCSSSAFYSFEGGECEVYTSMQVSEANGVMLYGFSSQEEKDMFLKLISVSGVGPKMGIALLSSMTLSDVTAAIAMGDIKRLSSVKGLGKKTAERIILELKDKTFALSDSAPAPSIVVKTEGDEDAEVALTTLGFSVSEARRAVAKARSEGANSVDEIIVSALRYLGK